MKTVLLAAAAALSLGSAPPMPARAAPLPAATSTRVTNFRRRIRRRSQRRRRTGRRCIPMSPSRAVAPALPADRQRGRQQLTLKRGM